jgi:uncharacterized membrane protein (UPF0136 family)
VSNGRFSFQFFYSGATSGQNFFNASFLLDSGVKMKLISIGLDYSLVLFSQRSKEEIASRRLSQVLLFIFTYVYMYVCMYVCIDT